LPPLSEADREDAEAFLADMLIIYQLLGINSFESLERAATATRLHLSGPDALASGAEVEDGCMVFAGALARAEPVGSIPRWAENIREGLVEAGLLVELDGGKSLRLTANHKLGSPSAAASVVLGRSANGTEEWKNESGESLRQIRARSVPEVTETG
jgi:hypothetical protein